MPLADLYVLETAVGLTVTSLEARRKYREADAASEDFDLIKRVRLERSGKVGA
jgi:hypothetical protein